MKKWVTIWFAVIVCTVIFSTQVPAKIMYVGDITKLNVRSDRSVDSDLIGKLASAEKVEVVTFTSGWTKIRLPDGTEGWVGSRFLTSDKPASIQIDELKEQLETIQIQVETMAHENNRLKTDNQTLTSSLNGNMEKLAVMESAYGSLKGDSKGYLKLKQQFDKISLEVSEKDKLIKSLEQKVSDTYLSNAITWFLIGAAVLLVGFFMGARTKKKRSSLI